LGTRVNDLTALPSSISAAAPRTVQVEVVDGETAEQLSARHGGAYGLYKGSKQGLPLEEQQTQKKIDGQLKTYFAAQGWAYREPVLAAAAR
jgi:squalene cyclase